MYSHVACLFFAGVFPHETEHLARVQRSKLRLRAIRAKLGVISGLQRRRSNLSPSIGGPKVLKTLPKTKKQTFVILFHHISTTTAYNRILKGSLKVTALPSLSVKLYLHDAAS